MSKDLARNHLITRLYCFDCGNQLDLTYDDRKKKDAPFDQGENDEPSGGYKMVNKITVHPCRHCIDKYTAPAKALVNAVKQIQENL